jgi:flagellar biosynthesis/type III secretory pathway protein FliH
MSDPATSTEVLSVGVLIAMSQFVLPFYNTFLKKQEMIKEQNDQFHKRDNHAIDEIWQTKVDLARQQGYEEGFEAGKAEVRAQRADFKS